MLKMNVFNNKLSIFIYLIIFLGIIYFIKEVLLGFEINDTAYKHDINDIHYVSSCIPPATKQPVPESKPCVPGITADDKKIISMYSYLIGLLNVTNMVPKEYWFANK